MHTTSWIVFGGIVICIGLVFMAWFRAVLGCLVFVSHRFTAFIRSSVLRLHFCFVLIRRGKPHIYITPQNIASEAGWGWFCFVGSVVVSAALSSVFNSTCNQIICF